MPQIPAIAPLDPADKKASMPITKTCVRCRQHKSTIVLQTATFCHECFQFNFEGKIRQNLEQSRLCIYLHRNEISESSNQASLDSTSIPSSSSTLYPCKGRIMIGFSGGVASRTLLHIAKARLLPAQHDRRNGKLQEVHAIDVVYVDTSVVLPDTPDETERIRAIVQEEGGEAEGIYFWPLKLQDVFDDGQAVECTAEFASLRYLSSVSKPSQDKEAALRSLFNSIQPADTPKSALSNARSRAEDLLWILITQLLRREAIRRRATCLMTGETATRSAIRLIESIGKGRGHKVAVEEGSVRWNGLFLLRPMKTVTIKEVILYSRGTSLSHLPPMDIVALQLLSSKVGVQDGGNGNKASMGRLTESLIHLLEKNVPSTVSTINKIGDKLVFSDDLASHGYQDEEEDTFGVNASSSNAFQQVGPSVPLRFRSRQLSTSTQISKLSLSSNLSNGPVPGGVGDRSLQGLGLGRMGSTLYYAAKKMFSYNGALACPLCQMPSQRGLHAWKRGLTVKSNKEDNNLAQNETLLHQDWINLTDLLCYACTIVLDTPESTKKDLEMKLPSFVLYGAHRRLREASGDTLLDEEDINSAHAILNGSASNTAQSTNHSTVERHEKQTMQKLDREQMKQHLNGFLLADEESQPSTPSHRERKQIDW